MDIQAKTPRQMLTKVQSFELMSVIKEHYTASGKTDKEFAEWFSAEHFPVKETHVDSHRSQLGIPAKRFAKVEATRVAAEEVLAMLTHLTQRVDAIYIYLSGQAERDL